MLNLHKFYKKKHKSAFCFLLIISAYGISSSYSPSLTSSGVRETSNLSGLRPSNGTIGSDAIAPSAAVTSLSNLTGTTNCDI